MKRLIGFAVLSLCLVACTADPHCDLATLTCDFGPGGPDAVHDPIVPYCQDVMYPNLGAEYKPDEHPTGVTMCGTHNENGNPCAACTWGRVGVVCAPLPEVMCHPVPANDPGPTPVLGCQVGHDPPVICVDDCSTPYCN